MDHRFLCTVCGKCCYGWLPLTLDDAVTNAERFPLAMIWTPIRQGTKAFDMAERLGMSVSVGKKKRIAVRLSPASYVPSALACPALDDDGLHCTIHATKPLRCRTMPFYPYRAEEDQHGFLNPRKGWDCNISQTAPVVYSGKRIVDRFDFDTERAALEADAPILRNYAERLMATSPNVAAALEQAASKQHGGTVTLNFTAIVPRLKTIDIKDFARKQLPVLEAFAKRTVGNADFKDYHKFYSDAAAGMGRFLAGS